MHDRRFLQSHSFIIELEATDSTSLSTVPAGQPNSYASPNHAQLGSSSQPYCANLLNTIAPRNALSFQGLLGTGVRTYLSQVSAVFPQQAEDRKSDAHGNKAKNSCRPAVPESSVPTE